MKIALQAALVATLAVVFSPLVLAQNVQAPGKACKADTEKLCPGMKPGDGKIGACMKEHSAELSPDCLAALKGAKAFRQSMKTSCKADTEKFCATAPKDHGGITKCLESHVSELAPACAEALKTRPGQKKT
jgi:hypothetical protein